MEIDKDLVFKFLVLGGLIAGTLLLISFQFLFAIVLFIIAAISYWLWKKI